MLKKTVLAIFGLVISGSIWSGSSGLPSEIDVSKNVIVPCESKKWSFGVQGLYLQPIFQGFSDAEANFSFQNPNARWNGAYRLEGTYQRYTGNIIGMTYLHFSNGVHRPNVAGFFPLLNTTLPFNRGLDNRFDQVNLTLGQHFLMGCGKNAHLYGGLQYARFRIDSNNWSLVPVPLPVVGSTRLNLSRNIDYNGLGPLLGVDYRYDLASGLSVGASGASSILFGSSRYNGSLIATSSGLVVSGIYSSKKSIVPGLETKLRLNYTCATSAGLINIEGGYQVFNYFNLPKSRWPLDLRSVTNDSMFGLQGPYAGVKWVSPI